MIRLAGLNDLSQINQMILKIKIELKNMNNPQWGKTINEYPSNDDFYNDIKKENLYVYEEDNIIKGVIYVAEDFENEYVKYICSSNLKSYVIHRLGVSLDYRRQQIGKKLLEYVEKVALQNRAKILKIDIEHNNIKMKNFLEKLNFEYIGSFQAEYPGDYDYYEKKLEKK